MNRSALGANLRRALMLTVLAGLVAISNPTLSWWIVGLSFLVAGEAVRSWAAGHLVKTESLVLTGPYRYTRNPLYLGRLLIWIGFVAVCRITPLVSAAILTVGLTVFFGYYLPRKERVEPARLERHHGERYVAYRDAVPALFPRLSAYPASGSASWSVQRFLANREHWMVAGVTVVALIQAVRLAGSS